MTENGGETPSDEHGVSATAAKDTFRICLPSLSKHQREAVHALGRLGE